MNTSPLLQQFEAGDAALFKLVRFVLLLGGTLLLGFTAILPLAWPQQLLIGTLTVAVVLWLDRGSGSYFITLTLLLVSIFSTFRYGFWRLHAAERFFFATRSKAAPLDAIFILLLLFAETYAAVTLFVGYMQTLWPLRRAPVALPDDPDLWPAVDLLIPTLNEPLSLVKFTALAARNIDWPHGKLNVWILDDGNRAEFRRFAEEAGLGYIARKDASHARAGSINAALSGLSAPYVAIFDCDHVPTRSFLQITLGWFLRDSRLGMLQTPHHLDSSARNPEQLNVVPDSSGFFSNIVQDGNDFWNATFFCGSCAILRRTALDQIGGIAVGTVTEDTHTSLRMQRNGWNAAYINIPQAAALAADRLDGHVRQRIQWARGMAQILRTENPFFARGLTLAQRLCCFNAMTHFLFALPRLIFLTAPLVCLLFGRVNIPGYWAAILAYAFPHLALSSIANARIQGHRRFSLWNDICETVLAPYLLLPILLAFLNPKAGRVKQPPTYAIVNRSFFDRRTAKPFFLLIGTNLLGILCAIPRLVRLPIAAHAFPFNLLAGMYDVRHTGLIVINLLWACFNLVILSVATSVAWQSRQSRRALRIAMTVPADIELAGSILSGLTSDVSTGGLLIRMEHAVLANPGDPIRVTLPVFSGSATLPATLVGVSGNLLRAKFDPLTLDQEEALTIVLFSRADTWLGWGEEREPEKLLTTLRRTVRLTLRGLGQSLRNNKQPEPNQPANLASTIAPLILLAVLFATHPLAGQKPSPINPHPTQINIQKLDDTAPNPNPASNPDQNQDLIPSLPDDLTLLPAPFFAQTDLQPAIPIVFLAQPSPKALEAAGIVASWFGILAPNRQVRFPVTIGAIPSGNAIVISEKTATLPASLQLAPNSRPTIAIRTAPSDPSSKLLILTANSPDGLLTAARVLALKRDLLQGSTFRISPIGVSLPGQPSDEPRPVSTEKITILPDLKLFATTGYPFTRKPDLSGTAVVLPETPAPEEIELYLALMAHFAAGTGYPVLSVTVTNPTGITSGDAKDYLVLGTVNDQPAIARLNPSLPVGIDGSGLHIQDTQGFFAPLEHAWWKVRSLDRVQPAQIETAGGLPDALIEAIEWPRRSARSAVLILLRDKGAVPSFLSSLKSSQSEISQSVSVLQGSRFTSYRIGGDVYRTGSPSFWLRLNLFFADYPWLIVLLIFTASSLMALIFRSTLRRKARTRLQGDGWAQPEPSSW
ncbi:MAG: cellulose biosynthesis cyclic di-GMP-binding regulatory protein BcsB [Edaphobacter sp.]